MKPLIGISGNIKLEENERFPGYSRVMVGNDYVESVSMAGGVPVILPIIEAKEDAKRQIDRIDGLILTGGQDVNPFLYGEDPSHKLGPISPLRDEYEQHLIGYAIQQNKPILAICRGVQILNVTFGGSLYQDISMISSATKEHAQREKSDAPSHSVTIYENTHLFQIYGQEISVNSFHHQAIKKIAPGFKTAAISEDGVIEAIEKEGSLFVVGVQWHPELMTKKHAYMLRLFKLYIRQFS